MKRIAFIVVFASVSALSIHAEEIELGWDHSSEAGVALSGGNSAAETYTVKQETSYLWEESKIKTQARYFLSFGNNQKSGENWLIGARYEHVITGNLGAYVGNSWEGNVFSGFDYRTNVDIGGQYYVIPGDKKRTYLLTELGYRYSYEDRVAGSSPETVNIHAIRLYAEGTKPLTDYIWAKLWVEFLPDVSDSENIMINFEPSVSVTLSEYLALKLAFLGKYDGKPVPGSKKFDYLYTTSLVANF